MKGPIEITDLEFEDGNLVKVRGARPEYFDGHTLITLVREMASAWRGFVEVIAARQIDELNKPTPSVVLTYTNYRGETAERRIIPQEVWYGSTEWHPEPQWLLKAFDFEKNASRDFALKDFGKPAIAQDALQSIRDYACETWGETWVSNEWPHLEKLAQLARSADVGAKVEPVAWLPADEAPRGVYALIKHRSGGLDLCYKTDNGEPFLETWRYAGTACRGEQAPWPDSYIPVSALRTSPSLPHRDGGDVGDVERLRTALSAIAHTFTEDSFGNMKTLPADEYQRMAREALAALGVGADASGLKESGV